MDLQQLQYFQAVVEQGSISQAAELLHIAQPSLSISISKLEKELGVRLFDRTNHKIRLNRIGQRFYARTQRIFVDVQEALTEISDIAESRTKEVRIASTTSNICTELLSAFMSEHPDYQITQFIHGQPHVQELLETGAIDFAIATEPFDSGIVEWRPLIEERLVILLSRKHPLAAAKELSIAEIKDERFVVLRSAFHPEGEFADFFKAAGFQPTPAFVTNEYEVMAAMVEQNVGMGPFRGVTVAIPGGGGVGGEIHTGGFAHSAGGRGRGRRQRDPQAPQQAPGGLAFGGFQQVLIAGQGFAVHASGNIVLRS